MRALAALLPFLAFGLAQVDLTLSPPRLELLLSPGVAWEDAVVVRNDLPQPEALAVRIAPFALGEGGEVLPGLERNLCPYLSVVPTAFSVPPQGSAEVRLSVNPPPEAEGTLYCLVFFTTQPRAVGVGGIHLQARPEIGLVVYVTLSGTERPALRVEPIRAQGEALRFRLGNPGNVLLRLSGEAVILALTGEEVARLPFTDLPLLPGGVRWVELKPEPLLPKGSYRVVLLLRSPYGHQAAEGVWDVP